MTGSTSSFWISESWERKEGALLTGPAALPSIEASTLELSFIQSSQQEEGRSSTGFFQVALYTAHM
jgi:hypothetical protein